MDEDRPWPILEVNIVGAEDASGAPLQDPYVTSASEAERAAIRAAVEALRQGGALRVTPTDPEQGAALELSGAARSSLFRVLAYLAEGLAVRVEPYTSMLTTSRAAALLGVSRPTVVELMRTNRLRGERTADAPGRHRRIPLSEVLRYRQQLQEDAAILDTELDDEESVVGEHRR